MPRLRVDFTVFHTSSSAPSSFERVYFRRVVRHSRRRTDNWLFRQYIELLLRLCPQRGIEWSHAATTFHLVTRSLSMTQQTLPNQAHQWALFPRGIPEACPCWVVLCSNRGSPSFATLSCVHLVTLFLHTELNALVVSQGSHLENAPVAYPWDKTERDNRKVNYWPHGHSFECHLLTPIQRNQIISRRGSI